MTNCVPQNVPQKRAFNPKLKALQFRAWQRSMQAGADMTIEELAQSILVPATRLRRALRGEKWAIALRSSALDTQIQPYDGRDGEIVANAEARNMGYRVKSPE